MSEKKRVEDADLIFEKIIKGEMPCQFVMENEHVFCFQDISPQAPKHYLMVPKRRVSRLSEVLESEGGLEQAAACLQALVVMGEREQGGFGIGVNNGIGALQTVFHLHFHFLSARALKKIDFGGDDQTILSKAPDHTLYALPRSKEDPVGPRYHRLQMSEKVGHDFLTEKKQDEQALGVWRRLVKAVVEVCKKMGWSDFRLLIQSDHLLDQDGHLNVILVEGEGMSWPPF